MTPQPHRPQSSGDEEHQSLSSGRAGAEVDNDGPQDLSSRGSSTRMEYSPQSSVTGVGLDSFRLPHADVSVSEEVSPPKASSRSPTLARQSSMFGLAALQKRSSPGDGVAPAVTPGPSPGRTGSSPGQRESFSSNSSKLARVDSVYSSIGSDEGHPGQSSSPGMQAVHKAAESLPGLFGPLYISLMKKHREREVSEYRQRRSSSRMSRSRTSGAMVGGGQRADSADAPLRALFPSTERELHNKGVKSSIPGAPKGHLQRRTSFVVGSSNSLRSQGSGLLR